MPVRHLARRTTDLIKRVLGGLLHEDCHTLTARPRSAAS
jgi:hypothetical protein